MQKFTIDATNKKPGRLATEIAVLLMGKYKADFAKNKIPDVQVEVTNADLLILDQKKLVAKTYATHSGYPGKLKLTSMQDVVDKKGAKEVLRRAVLGMLPKNKLRPEMIKRLTIKD
ncbi:uL13 family ribosomal protein [Candidatus Parcubacteria bacterium]|nr:uL13 family ribosomal protein [Candidatus Parcubacteria bacterium]